MKSFFTSATQLVLVLFALVLSITMLVVVVMNPTDNDLVKATQALFAACVISVISFYFGQKSIPAGGTVESQTVVTKSSPPPTE